METIKNHEKTSRLEAAKALGGLAVSYAACEVVYGVVARLTEAEATMFWQYYASHIPGL